jgi:hypothetical protein
MKRSMLFSALALLISASASHAVSLGVISDKSWYFIGETITLSIVGDAQGATAYGIYGRLVFNGAAVDNVSRTQKTIGPSWIKGSLEAGDTNLVGPATAYAEAFDQVNLNGAS